MTDRSTCGYQGHICDTRGAVQFISRYQGSNAYCVGGDRVNVKDNGQTDGTAAQVEAIRLYEVAKHEQYLVWHAENRQRYGLGEPQPFDFPFAVSRKRGREHTEV